MGRQFISGDKHGDYVGISVFCSQMKTTKDDAIIILGDNGVNDYGECQDRHLKRKLEKLPITFIMIRGNHDQRPSKKIYKEVEISTDQYEGTFLVEEEFPSLLFTKEFGLYTFGGEQTYVIGGAYSVDKFFRLEMNALGYKGYRWFYDEQLSDSEKKKVSKEFADILRGNNGRLQVMAHTCPLKYKPFDKLIPGIDQSTVDESTEKWMNDLCEKAESELDFFQWFCGHWHIDKEDGPVKFFYRGIEEITKSTRNL